jgi:hypothetical protein
VKLGMALYLLHWKIERQSKRQKTIWDLLLPHPKALASFLFCPFLFDKHCQAEYFRGLLFVPLSSPFFPVFIIFLYLKIFLIF